ncbi:MAG TPA: hypothetical protein VLH39_01845, partial [Magnetospirillaceae bacterium]|nr:hypothetical protein [Magnetospirillaceae bacterium]
MRPELVRLVFLDRERVMISHVASLLSWDQETGMPPAAGEERASQFAWLEGVAHEKAVHPEVGRLLEALGCTDGNPAGDPSLDADARAFLRLMHRNYSRAIKLPAELVRETARAQSLGHSAWIKARASSDFPAFLPHLERLLELRRLAAASIEPSRAPYDVLLDLFEPGSCEASVCRVFDPLREDLTALLNRIRSRPQVDDSCLRR